MVVVQLFWALFHLWISCSTTRKLPNLSYLPSLGYCISTRLWLSHLSASVTHLLHTEIIGYCDKLLVVRPRCGTVRVTLYQSTTTEKCLDMATNTFCNTFAFPNSVIISDYHCIKTFQIFHDQLQSGAAHRSWGFEGEDLGSSPGWWAATVATYCPSKPGELPKSLSSKPHDR